MLFKLAGMASETSYESQQKNSQPKTFA